MIKCNIIDTLKTINALEEHLNNTNIPFYYPGIFSAIESWLTDDKLSASLMPERGYMWICPKCGLSVHSDHEECVRCGYKR